MHSATSILPLTSHATPRLIRATGYSPAPLYQRVVEAEWRLEPWAFVPGEGFLELYRELNQTRHLSRDTPRDPALLPFARRTDRGVVACFRARSDGPQVVLVRPETRGEEFTALPDFAAWLRLALDDVIDETEVTPQAAPAGHTPQPLPLDQPEETTADMRSSTRKHLLRLLRESEVDLGFVSIEAGDQELTSPSMRRDHERVKRERGQGLYGDMLFVLTQHRYPDRFARWLWTRIMRHKQELSERLGRAVEVTVASLDYLNQNEHLVEGSLVLCSEDELNQVAEVALQDGLTGLFDQATLKLRLQREVDRVRRYGGELSLLMLDLDHFKALNDTHGHPTGDRVLADLGQLLQREARAVDLTARYGGEEFAVLLPHTARGDAQRFAERIRRAVEATFSDLGVTVSLGVATYPGDGQDAGDLLAAADEALYHAKQHGRNRVSCSPSLPASARASV